uniref:NADH-ubiquinone oxidoreductase chain 3 n=1 Tax=Myrmica scabrinodis TaxID=207696 RepID=A0A0A8P347_9HYME|nr:NADH dehydrogenase subunit 3 [Myrmica scabrinodis]CEF49546.1 NADH dehydrogenase subunit 3 [Myrmica scabrinodis]
MYFLCLLIIILMIISMLLFFLNFILSKKMINNREKMSPFECGFDPMSKQHLPFSIQFFMISLIFLIFDIEITLLIPLIFMTYNFNLPMIMTSFIFLFILIFGLYIEYTEQSLDWKI